LSQRIHHRTLASLVAAATFMLPACASPVATAGPTAQTSQGVAPTTPPSSATASPPGPTESTNPPVTGFAFAADDIVAYYQTQGYACSARQPSTKAVGFFVRTCQKIDDAGRTRVIGVVTDPSGGLANGFASVQGKDAETFLAPIDALDPLAGFLGAMLGEDQGSGLLPWLAGNLGDAYAETAVGGIRVATYTASADDHSRLYVEVANQAYLDAPGVPAP
jgi:hypothetical protein